MPSDMIDAERARQTGPAAEAALPAAATPAMAATGSLGSLGGRSAVVAARASRLAARRKGVEGQAAADPVPGLVPPERPAAPRSLKHWRPWRRAKALATEATPERPETGEQSVPSRPRQEDAPLGAPLGETSIFATLLQDAHAVGLAPPDVLPVADSTSVGAIDETTDDPAAPASALDTSDTHVEPSPPDSGEVVPTLPDPAPSTDPLATPPAGVAPPVSADAAPPPPRPPGSDTMPAAVPSPSVFAELGPGMQIRLRQIGYGNDAALAEADPAILRVALGDISQLLNVEHWIAEAQRRRA